MAELISIHSERSYLDWIKRTSHFTTGAAGLAG